LPGVYANYYTHAATVRRSDERGRWHVFRSRLPWHRTDEQAVIAYLTGVPPGRVLDLGCGDGTRLARLAAAGWNPIGVDMDRNAVEAARRSQVGEVRLGTVHDVGPPSSFDAVVMFHVLEHVDDPLATLVRARQLLRPGGLLSITTPNADSWLHRIYGARWRGLEPPRHLQIFTPSGLGELLGEAGFREFDSFTTARNAGPLAFASSRAYGRRLPPVVRRGLSVGGELLQALEWLRLHWQPDCGEELVALASRGRK
jgi:SAM-dependent methyltransferase